VKGWQLVLAWGAAFSIVAVMRPLRALGIYGVAVFLGGALLAPWVFRFSQFLSHSSPGVAQQPFQRFLINSLLAVAVAGLWPLFRAQGVTSFREAGLANPISHWRKLLAGLAFGLGSLAVVAVISLAAGGRVFNSVSAGRLAWKLSGAVFSAAGVAMLEEVLFRGGVFGGLRRVFHWPFALVVSSMVYAVMHFLEDAEFHGAVTWVSGLELLPWMFGGDTAWAQLAPKFLNLTLAGVLLGLAYQRTGNLWFSIGLHAGWIFWLASYRLFTADVSGASAWFWGSSRMVDGWLAFGALSLALVLFTRLPLARKNNSFT
jgi:uncharacterized protein